MKKIPVIIDCDIGMDDALALVLVCASKKLSILGVTTVSGNVDVERNEMVFAHCKLLLNMPEEYSLMTHFESGIGVMLRGTLLRGEYTLFKCYEDGRFFVQSVVIHENLTKDNLCRTQILLSCKEVTNYLTVPLSNHQVICRKDVSSLVKKFFAYRFAPEVY